MTNFEDMSTILTILTCATLSVPHFLMNYTHGLAIHLNQSRLNVTPGTSRDFMSTQNLQSVIQKLSSNTLAVILVGL